MKIDHVAIAVRSLDETLASLKAVWGLEPEYIEEVGSDGVVEAMLPLGDAHIQLLEPTSADSTVSRFLERRGEGLHHIGIRVPDIEDKLDELRSRGAQLIDEAPRIGGGGHRVAFVHPKTTSGVLIELVEKA
jgi:methylmalonyl-CoA/ethylmalonyl-CoA epimerase